MTDNPYLRAIEIIKERGWWQGDWEGPNGEVCIARSLVIAGHPQPAFSLRLQEAMQTVAHMLTKPERRLGPGDWNDAPERTVEDVYLALKHAAADWDDEHDAGVASA